jgi:hypothetical protein
MNKTGILYRQDKRKNSDKKRAIQMNRPIKKVVEEG